ncbi:hypothetical protein [Microcoleus sp. BROC3]|uniref:hypothetical protein n=1 Tax=Microcoleus sp. BROC3 TaxID=3055323 RepID=UPI002FD2E2B9
MPPISKSAVATLSMHAARPCIGKLSNDFAFPNLKVVLRGLYDMKPKMLSDLSRMRSIRVRGECAHPP